jgi:DNA-binding NarL/FixJ family response regulator
MISVALVDDHELVRTGFRMILAQHKDLHVAGEAASGEDAVRLAKQVKPQVILMDLNLPGTSGLEATERIVKHDKNVRVIIVTAHDTDPYPRRLLDVGASGFLTKACPADELVGAIRTVARGGKHLSPAIAQRLALAAMPGGDDGASPFDKLSPRELEVCVSTARGLSMPQVAERLSISAKTVATHKYRVYEKLGVDSEVALTLLALQYGLIQRP